MAGDAPALNTEKPFAVTNIKTHVHLALDVDQLNYDASSDLFTTHCLRFGVLGFLDGPITKKTTNELEWKKLNSLVKIKI